MISETTSWEPTITWLLTAMIAPLAIGVALGLFARNAIRWMLIVAVLAGVTAAVLALGGLLQVEAARTALGSICRMLAATADVVQRGLTGTPVPCASVLTGLAAGLCVREAWRRNRKGAEC